MYAPCRARVILSDVCSSDLLSLPHILDHQPRSSDLMVFFISKYQVPVLRFESVSVKDDLAIASVTDTQARAKLPSTRRISVPAPSRSIRGSSASRSEERRVG